MSEIKTYDEMNKQICGLLRLAGDNAYYLEKYKLGIFRNEDFDNMVFTDYDKAKLKEIRG